MNKKTGGPAFPCEIIGIDMDGEYRKPFAGMTLRDYFAAKAMLGFLTLDMQDEYLASETAKEAYRYADAMLKERQK